MKQNVAQMIQKASRVVIKVGTSVLTDAKSKKLSYVKVQAIAKQVAQIHKANRQVLVVSSGAIGAGMRSLGYKSRPHDLSKLQAASAVGQGKLMHLYESAFSHQGFHAAQILLTRDDLHDRRRYLNAKATLSTLLSAGVIPVVNENDTISTEEIRVGDNDQLAGLVAALAEADLLILLSDVDGFCRGGRGTELIPVVTKVTAELERLAKGSGKATSTGGMKTKLQAAKASMASGIPMLMANGHKANVLSDAVLKGKWRGTLFLPSKSPLTAKGRWLALGARVHGAIVVDTGAREALSRRGKSLLATGVTGVQGSFSKGDVVKVVDTRAQEFARGVAGFSASDLKKIAGKQTAEVTEILGRTVAPEVIHRDRLVILTQG